VNSLTQVSDFLQAERDTVISPSLIIDHQNTKTHQSFNLRAKVKECWAGRRPFFFHSGCDRNLPLLTI